MAVRYDQKKKNEVLAFIEEYNNANKRGGQTAAAAKFGITALTLSKWQKKSGGAKRGRKPKKATAKKGPGRGRGKGRGPGKAAAGGWSAVFDRMVAIRKQIDTLEAEFGKLKNQL